MNGFALSLALKQTEAQGNLEMAYCNKSVFTDHVLLDNKTYCARGQAISCVFLGGGVSGKRGA